MSFTNINIETLILVAIWKQPYIFQGCFKIATLSYKKEEFFFFRCECNQSDIIESDFSPEHYHFTHLYSQSQQIGLDKLTESKEYALYTLKYALFRTIKEMLTNQAQKQHIFSIDEVALESLMHKVKPMLNRDALWSESMKEIGFAVAMDFYPQEEMGESAVRILLSHFGELEFVGKTIH